MRRYVITAFAIALTFLNVEFTLLANAQNENAVKLKDPGFESFKLAKGPIFGWYSEDIDRSSDQQFARITMTRDSEVKVEGEYSLRIEQAHPRPLNRGQAFLSQAVLLPKEGDRSFELAMQTRGRLKGPLTVEIYVWEKGNIAKAIAHRDSKVKMEWNTTTLSFKVPKGYDQFGIWIYLPREEEAQVWLDDVRLQPQAK